MDVEIIEADLQDDLVCSVCYAEFLDKEDLEVHIKQLHLNETNKSRFCELCSRIFQDIEEYALHLRNTHSSGLKCCKYCSRLFKSSLEAQEHEKKHNVAVLYPKVSCSHCKKVFNTKEEVKNHEVKQHIDSIDGFMLLDCLPILSSLLCMNVQQFFNSLPYKCVVCDKTTVDVNQYIQHLVDHDKCKAHACNDCCDVYPNKAKLRKHMLKHIHGSTRDNTSDSLSQCPKCKLPFKATSLKMHKKVCTGMRCVLCNLYFNSIAEYTSHRLAKHRAKLPVLEVCFYCQRQMVGADSLKKHIERVHKNDKHLYKYHCIYCNRLFKHPKFLFAHFYTQHKDLHPYTCRICDKTFRIRKNFSLHIKLTHKSIGFVEFDDNFHVFFTQKKPYTQSKSETVLDDENADDENDGSTFKNNDHDYCENSSLFEEKTCPVEMEKIQNDCNEPNKELGEVDVKKSNNKEHENVENRNDRNDDDMTTDCEAVALTDDKKSVKKPVLKKRKIIDANNATDDVSSDDSDVPLKTVSKKLKLQKNQMRRAKRGFNKLARSKKFVCTKCDKDCYTFQNYHRHKALHLKNETKVCIKCYGKFDSVKKLENHIKKEHSSSQLTETLKKLLEKRKIAEATSKKEVKIKEFAKSKEITNAKQVISMPRELIPLSTSEKFRKTIKKVNTERNISTKVTMKLIDKDKISVKKYLENFTPESNDVKITVIKDPVSSETARVKKLRPLIKLTKCAELIPEQEFQKATLKMPVKFTDDLIEDCQVRIKLVADFKPPAMTFYGKVEDDLTDNNYEYDTYETYESEADSKDVIPEVAQEVMLEGTVEQNTIVRTMNFNNLPTWHKVQIAHLSTEAPYFKISKINLGTETSFTLTPEGNPIKQEDTPRNITLPNGKQLISVNPFEHLLNKQTMEELKSSKSKNKAYYKPKISNAAEAIKTALQKLEKSHPIKEKKKV